MLTTYEQESKKKLVAIVVAVIVIGGTVVLADHFTSSNKTTAASSIQTATTSQTSTDPTTTSTTDNAATTNTQSTSTTSTSGSYKDGSYNATSSYYVPHGNESIQVSVTLSNGVIIDASIQNSEGDHESAEYQEDFASLYKSYVVGKQISGLKLGVLAGASDTTEGFNEALTKIASEAQA